MTTRSWIIGTAAAVLLLNGSGLAGCEREGPAERAGKNIDKATERAGDKVKEAGDRIKDASER